MARTVADAAVLYEVLSGVPRPLGGAAPRLVEATSWRTGHEATDALFDEVMASLRRRGVAVAARAFAVPPAPLWEDEFYLLLCEFRDDLTAYLAERSGEGVRSMQDVIDFEKHHADVEFRHFGHELFTAAMDTNGRASADYRERLETLTNWVIGSCLEPGLGGDDVVLSPAYAPAWPSTLATGDVATGASPSVSMAAIVGWPIATVPIGLVDGLPVGLTLVGRPDQEWSVLNAAATIEEVVHRAGWECRPRWLPRSAG
jgi:amidase